MIAQNSSYTFILMGVSGSGKSRIAHIISHQLNIAFLDGDFLHPRDNITKMLNEEPLSDKDRQPWLQAVRESIFAMNNIQKVSVITCSALKKDYRDILCQGNTSVTFIYLKSSLKVTESRLQNRREHFFKSNMLKDQFAILEEPSSNEESNVVEVDADAPLKEVVTTVASIIKKACF